VGDSPITLPESSNHKWVAAAVAALLVVLFVQLAFIADRNSITWDEDDHIYAGYMSLKHGDFGLNPEHPPLVKMLAAVPLLPMELKMPPLQGRSFKIEAFLNGKDFIFKNDFNKMIWRARVAASLLTVLLVLLIFLATQEMFGTGAAFIALTLMVFDPNLLAHGAVVATDIGLSCFMFASVYAFYRYVRIPSRWRMIVVGIATGLALAAKHTAVLLFPMLFMLAGTEVFRSEKSSRSLQIKRFAVSLVAIAVIALTILWAFYGFRYQARPDGLQLNPPMAESLSNLSRPHEARLLAGVAHWHLLPESYI